MLKLVVYDFLLILSWIRNIHGFITPCRHRQVLGSSVGPTMKEMVPNQTSKGHMGLSSLLTIQPSSALSGALDLLWNREVGKFVILLSASGYKDSWVSLPSSLSFSQSLFWETELVLGWAAARQYKVLPSYIWSKSLVWQFMPFSFHPGRIELGIAIFLVENFHRLPHCYLFASTINQTDGFIFSSQVPFSGL